eukprot:TRINITY_DN6154_c0_g1_i16.p1 TRINITY_DN6154_c0_g1~~TRINITY_DN6154_c0_g1_i16.p1  ORF type:complete len:313 (-),score=72.31 TRINITY_DN6154_c0_g1_i16:202-1041(-)
MCIRDRYMGNLFNTNKGTQIPMAFNFSYRICSYTIFSFTALSALVISAVSKGEIEDYVIPSNKRIFQTIANITLSPIPSLQAIAFVIYLGSVIVFVFVDRKKREIAALSLNDESNAMIDRAALEKESQLKINEILENRDYTNLLLTYLFIYFTKGLSLLVAMFLLSEGVDQLDRVTGDYRRDLDQTGLYHSVERQKTAMNITMGVDAFLLGSLLVTTILDFYFYKKKHQCKNCVLRIIEASYYLQVFMSVKNLKRTLEGLKLYIYVMHYECECGKNESV